MNPPPGAFRWTTLLATGVVVLGGACGFVLWHRIATDPSALPAASGPREGGAGIRRLDPPAGLAPGEADRLRDLVAACVDGVTTGERRRGREGLEAEGEAAVPFLLDAAARLSSEGRGFSDPEALPRLHRVDRPLSSIRRVLTPSDPAPPWRAAPDAAWALDRVAAWFAWWDARR